MKSLKIDIWSRLLMFLVAVTLICGCDNDPDVTALINSLRDDDREVRQDAAKELENIGMRGAAAAEMLGQCLKDEVAEVRYRAAKALSKLGKAAKPAIENLGLALSTDSDPKIQYYCAKAIAEIANQEPEVASTVIRELVSSLSKTESKTKYYVVKALGKIGAGAKDALGELEKLAVGDPDESTRKAADSAVRRIKKQAADSPSVP